MVNNAGAAKAQAFRVQVIEKIQALLNEFAEGNLNQEQFNVLYERYSGQLAMAQQALESGSADVVRNAPGDKGTIAIKQEYMGKAVGLSIYQNRTGAMIETLGDFEVSAFVISPVLSEFSALMEQEKSIEPRTEKLAAKRWLLFTGRRYTTVVTLFHNQPSLQQIREIERLHHDFEVANGAPLARGRLDSKTLAYPFVVFVQKKLKQG
ncbi:MAG: hypothetical protein K8I30_14685 [Anaerolineae bacterium]|nr:hypothetical protein [Anaerolineae bacterium]